MPRLKSAFEGLGFDSVRTYINSGNVIFATKARDKKRLTGKIEKAIQTEFGAQVAVLLRDLTELRKLIAKIPDDWTNDKDQRCDVLFLWSEFDRKKILDELPINLEIE